MHSLAIVAVLVMLSLSCSESDDAGLATPVNTPSGLPGEPSVPSQSPTEAITAPAPPPADEAPVTSRDTQAAVQDGVEVPRKICNQHLGWTKPLANEMTEAFTDQRFGDGTAPDPHEYTYYLRDFYFPTAFSASANKVWVAFSGSEIDDEEGETFCDPQELRNQGQFRMIRAIDQSVVGVKHLDNALLIIVEAGFFTGWQEVVFPYPREDPAFTNDGIKAIRVIDVGGNTLYQESWPSSGEAWSQTLQFGDGGGSLEFLTIGGILPYASTEIEIATGQPALRLYSSSPAVSDRDGSLVAIDENGNEAGSIEWSGEYGMWQSLGRLQLEPGRYTLRFEDAASDWRHFVLLAADVPLPPGVRD